ncbi:MAG: putative adenylate cyclase, partial [Streblomastix strix]
MGVLMLDSSQAGSFSSKDLNLLSTVATSIGTAMANQQLVSRILKEEKEYDTLARFLSPHLIKRIKQTGGELRRESQEVPNAAILFADIRNFTAWSSTREPKEIFTFLNEMFEKMVNIVFKNEGMLDKYIGDCMMATWGGNIIGSASTNATGHLGQSIDMSPANKLKNSSLNVSGDSLQKERSETS